MKLLLGSMLLVCVLLAGCSNVRTYTFERDRVDQRIVGNQGYFTGSASPAPLEREVPKRTMIGIDIEVPILPGEKGYQSSEKTKFYKKQKASASAKEDVTVVEENVTVAEEDWVK